MHLTNVDDGAFMVTTLLNADDQFATQQGFAACPLLFATHSLETL